jgi:hypothetical protein
VGGKPQISGINSTPSVSEMHQPGNRNRKGVPRVELITGDVNIHSVTALKRLPGVVDPSPERLHTDSWRPGVFVGYEAPSHAQQVSESVGVDSRQAHEHDRMPLPPPLELRGSFIAALAQRRSAEVFTPISTDELPTQRQLRSNVRARRFEPD